VYNHTTKVAQLREVLPSHGDVGVAVADYPKAFAFGGDHLAAGDRARWAVDGDCGAPAEIWEEATGTANVTGVTDAWRAR
jgi:hypothetical protein